MDQIEDEEIVYLGDKPYEFKEFFQIEPFLSDNITFSNFHQSIAKFGGPLALLANKNVVMQSHEDKSLSTDVNFFSSDGRKINSIQFDTKEEIVCFEFLQNELLFVLTKKPEVFLIDPFLKANKAQAFTLDSKFQGTISSAKVFGNNCAFCAKIITSSKVEEYRFYFIQNLNIQSENQTNIKVEEFFKLGLKEAPRDWIVIHPKQSTLGVLELQIAHPEVGIISLTEKQQQLLYSNSSSNSSNQSKTQLPIFKNIICVSMSPNANLIAYLLETGNSKLRLCVVSNEFEGSVVKISDVDKKDFQFSSQQNSRSLSQKMVWCGDYCCILKGDNQILMMGPNVSEIINLQEDYVLSTEVDGLRVLTKSSNKMLRLIPSSYLNIYFPMNNSEEIKPSAQLLENYQKLKNKQPFDDLSLRGNINQLKQAINECMDAAEFTTEDLKQQELLQAASYGKTYIGVDSTLHNEFGYLGIKLRVMNNFKLQRIHRMITAVQLNHLLKSNLQHLLIVFMLRYDYHELALNVCSQLQFQDKVKKQVFEHWAMRVIDNNTSKIKEMKKSFTNSSECIQLLNVEDDKIAEKIIRKLVPEQVHFISIVKKAMKEGRQKLARILLKQVPQAYKRIPVSIWMAKKCLVFEKVTQKMISIDEEECLKKIESEEWQRGVELKQKNLFLRELESALKSRESDLLYICLKEMDSNIKNCRHKFDIIKSKEAFSSHYKNYLKSSTEQCKEDLYLEYLSEQDATTTERTKSESSLEKGMYLLKKGLKVRGSQSVFEFLKQKKHNLQLAVAAMDKNAEDTFFIDQIQNELDLVERQLDLEQKQINNLKLNELCDWTVNKSVMVSLGQDDKDSNEQLQNKVKIYKVPQKMIQFLKVRKGIESKQFDQLELDLIEINKKQIVIQYEVVAAVLIEVGARDNAVRLILQIPNMEERVNTLLQLDEAKKAVNTIINSKKNYELLNMIKQQSKDQTIHKYIESQLASRGK